MSQWVSVNKKSPHDDDFKFVYSKMTGVCKAYYYFGSVCNKGWIRVCEDMVGHKIKGVTHWMDIPAIPEDDE